MSLPIGTIVLWSGAIVDIPTGFHLCDGNNGTPDLRDRFIAGAGLALNPGDTGGSVNHNHTFTGDGHNHQTQVGTAIPVGPGMSDVTTTNPATGTTDNSDGRPPYYSLAFIMFTG